MPPEAGWLVCQVQGSNPGAGGSGHRQPLCPADGRPLGTTPRAKCASLTRITTHERSKCQSLSVLALICTAPTKSGHVVTVACHSLGPSSVRRQRPGHMVSKVQVPITRRQRLALRVRVVPRLRHFRDAPAQIPAVPGLLGPQREVGGVNANAHVSQQFPSGRYDGGTP